MRKTIGVRPRPRPIPPERPNAPRPLDHSRTERVKAKNKEGDKERKKGLERSRAFLRETVCKKRQTEGVRRKKKWCAKRAIKGSKPMLIFPVSRRAPPSPPVDSSTEHGSGVRRLRADFCVMRKTTQTRRKGGWVPKRWVAGAGLRRRRSRTQHNYKKLQ